MKNCIICNEELTGKQEKFCGNKCRQEYWRTPRTKKHYENCVICGIKLKGKQTKYCSHKCADRGYYINNPESIKMQHKKYKEKYPERGHLHAAFQRCNNPNNHNYKNYGERGIEYHLTNANGKFLWIKCKAYLMNKPELHRIDSNGDYVMGNVIFIENVEHVKMKKGKRRK